MEGYAEAGENMPGGEAVRYHLDTIPVWDAVRQGAACPLCALRHRIERMDVERFLGASVMEPDVRVRVNEKGFCARHQEMLYRQKNRLGQALLLQSHLAETEKSLAPALDAVRAAAAGRKGVFRRITAGADARAEIKAAARQVRSLTESCILCDSIQENIRRYAGALLHLYATDPDFRAAFAASAGVCLPDLALLLELSADALHGGMLRSFVGDLLAAQERTMGKTADDLLAFTQKFDYRNAEKPWGDSRDAVERAANLLRSGMLGVEDK